MLLRLLGQGSLTLIPTTMVAQWFVRLRGRAMSVTSIGAIAGQATFPPLVHLLIAGTDWRTAWMVQAVLIWVLLLPRSSCSSGAPPDAISERREDEWTAGEAFRTSTFWLQTPGHGPS